MPKRYSSWISWVALATSTLGLTAAHAQSRAEIGPAEVLRDPIAALANDVPLGYAVIGVPADSVVAGSDAQLCIWALEDWVRNAATEIEIMPVVEAEAIIRINFGSPGAGRYGEMRPILVNGRRGAEVFVRTETDTLGPDIATAARADALFRDTVVYLTCLHELGHALGMVHTAEFADVMFFFGFGGDIHYFFDRYRQRLRGRDDFRVTSGLSSGDIAQLNAAYPTN